MKRGPSPAHTTPLIGMAELHDLSFAYQIAPLLRLLSEETELVADLLHARPWLAETDAQAVLETLLEQEWSGFVARLGRVGPWVFAPSVADLQALSAAYTGVVEQAGSSDLSGGTPSSLIGRLRDSGEMPGREAGRSAEEAEATFWALAQARAAQQRREWTARRNGQNGT